MTKKQSASIVAKAAKSSAKEKEAREKAKTIQDQVREAEWDKAWKAPEAKTIKVAPKSAPLSRIETKEVSKLLDAIRAKNIGDFIRSLDKIDVSLLPGTGFIKIFLESFAEPTDYEFSKKFFQSIIDKITIHEKQNLDSLQQIKANCLFQTAQIIIKQFSESKKLEVKHEEYTKALSMLEEANAINSDQNTQIMLRAIKGSVSKTIFEYHNPEEAWEFAEKSLDSRQEQLKEKNPSSILDALIVIAKVGSSIKDHQADALRYAEKAYNLATELNAKEDIASALKCMASIYESFGDNLKAAYLLKQVNIFEPVAQNRIDSNQSANDTSKLVPIKKYGITTDLELEIKAIIQQSVLDPISKASEDGKWFNMQLTGQYGIGGYINEDFLANKLGELNTPENIKIALSLCFEAINLGAMNSKNPLCSAIFANQFPEIMQEIIEANPQYFVDGFILQTSMKDASDQAPLLLGKTLEENAEYNKYFESAVTPIIEGRLKASIFQPIADLLKSGSWNQSVEDKILHYLSEECLTASKWFSKITGNNNLGQNLNAIPDALNIVRILGFKVITETLETTGSKNYDPIKAFMSRFPELATRIATDHHEYFRDNSEIEAIYNEVLSQKKSDNSMEEDGSSLVSEGTLQVTAVTEDQDLSGDMIESVD